MMTEILLGGQKNVPDFHDSFQRYASHFDSPLQEIFYGMGMRMKP